MKRRLTQLGGFGHRGLWGFRGLYAQFFLDSGGILAVAAILRIKQQHEQQPS